MTAVTPMTYAPADIERRWQDAWEKADAFKADAMPGPRKWYVMDLPPFANGTLHLGHVRNYVIADASARFHRQSGESVLYTSGFDVFGLPNDIAAAEAGCHPKELSDANVARITEQFRRLGLSHDRARVTDYSDPAFYRWVQWVFVKLWDAGFVYRADHEVNWCERCRTSVEDGLLTDTGACWRCDIPVEPRRLEQWFVRDTAVTEEVLEGMDALDRWPESVKNVQRRFVGRVEGLDVAVELDDGGVLQVFEEQPEAMASAAYVAVGRHHPLARRVGVHDESRARVVKDREARRAVYGNVAITPLGVSGRNPLTGQWLPVVACHPWVGDQQRAAFGIPGARALDADVAERLGLDVTPTTAATSAVEALVESGRAKWDVRYRLRDWHVSRQRYWGAPVPAVHCEACGPVAVPESALPVELPLDLDTSSAANPLAEDERFLATTCPACGAAARRDADTLGAYSSPWWYMWSAKPPEADDPFADAGARAWQPVDLMVGGTEQSTACFFHVRVIARLLLQLDLVEHAEPVTQLLALGMLRRDGVKMSKSGENAVSPDDLIDRFGVDALRMAVLGAAAPANSFEWSTDTVGRRHAWLAKVWALAVEIADALPTVSPDDKISPTSAPRRRLLQWVESAIGRATRAYHQNAYHLAVKDVTRLFESLGRFRALAEAGGSLDETDVRALAVGLRVLVWFLGPLAPHIAEEMWQMLGGDDMLATGSWPIQDAAVADGEHQQGHKSAPDRSVAGSTDR